jgi:hypothetical protein
MVRTFASNPVISACSAGLSGCPKELEATRVAAASLEFWKGLARRAALELGALAGRKAELLSLLTEAKLGSRWTQTTTTTNQATTTTMRKRTASRPSPVKIAVTQQAAGEQYSPRRHRIGQGLARR